MTTDNKSKIAANIYAEVNDIIKNHAIDCAEQLHDELDNLFEGYGVDINRKPLNAYTWEEIAAIADSGKAADTFKIGDAKTITLYTGEKVEVVILDFDCDTVSENGIASDKVAGITFGLKDMLDGEYEMDEDDDNLGGWAKCKMRNVYMPRFLKLLPADLQSVIKPVVKLTGTGGGSDDIISTDDKLFLLSQVEVIGDSTYTADGEGVQYAYFKQDDNNVIKLRGGSALSWWLRSPSIAVTTSFRYVYYYGYVSGYGSASNAYGVSFGFCL